MASNYSPSAGSRQFFVAMTKGPKITLDRVDGRFLKNLINEVLADPFATNPFDDGWFVGWMLHAPDCPFDVGEWHGAEWMAGYRQGKKERREDELLGPVTFRRQRAAA